MSFDDLGLNEPLLRAIKEEGYEEPTGVQQAAIPPALKGKDVLGCAQTGTGKTAAFALPILQRLSENPHEGKGKRPIRALILTPTRELASQIDDSLEAYGQHVKFYKKMICGGVSYGPQTQALKKGIDVLTATPGRLLDLMGRKGLVDLSKVEVFVLDEADRMLDMGFIDDIHEVIRHLPRQRQTLFFSATIPAGIKFLTDCILTDPVCVEVTPDTTAAETVTQRVYFVERGDKLPLLRDLLNRRKDMSRVLIFADTKRRADAVARSLNNSDIPADVIHSDRTQKERNRAMEKFKAGQTRVLVASDIAARGIDVEDVSHVVNFDLPPEPEVYVHRIGRTGRAGQEGKALSFCSARERVYLDAIERLMDQKVKAVGDHDFASKLPAPVAETKPRFGARGTGKRPVFGAH